MDFQFAFNLVVGWMCLACLFCLFGDVGKWVAIALMLFTFAGLAFAEPVPEPPAVVASAPAPARQAEPLPQSGCIVMAGRCSCVINGALRPSVVCPSAGRSRDLSGVFSRAAKPAQYVPFPEFRPAPLPPAEPARLGRFWVY